MIILRLGTVDVFTVAFRGGDGIISEEKKIYQRVGRTPSIISTSIIRLSVIIYQWEAIIKFVDAFFFGFFIIVQVCEKYPHLAPPPLMGAHVVYCTTNLLFFYFFWYLSFITIKLLNQQWFIMLHKYIGNIYISILPWVLDISKPFGFDRFQIERKKLIVVKLKMRRISLL